MTHENVRAKIKLWTSTEVAEKEWCGIKCHVPEVWHRKVVNGPAPGIPIPLEYQNEWEEYCEEKNKK
jgi:hypothetical protein